MVNQAPRAARERDVLRGGEWIHAIPAMVIAPASAPVLHVYCAVYPPSTVSTCPVMKRASSETPSLSAQVLHETCPGQAGAFGVLKVHRAQAHGCAGQLSQPCGGAPIHAIRGKRRFLASFHWSNARVVAGLRDGNDLERLLSFPAGVPPGMTMASASHSGRCSPCNSEQLATQNDLRRSCFPRSEVSARSLLEPGAAVTHGTVSGAHLEQEFQPSAGGGIIITRSRARSPPVVILRVGIRMRGNFHAHHTTICACLLRSIPIPRFAPLVRPSRFRPVRSRRE